MSSLPFSLVWLNWGEEGWALLQAAMKCVTDAFSARSYTEEAAATHRCGNSHRVKLESTHSTLDQWFHCLHTYCTVLFTGETKHSLELFFFCSCWIPRFPGCHHCVCEVETPPDHYCPPLIQAHLPPPHSMSSFVELSETSDSKLLPCSCSASWKLHSIAIKVMWSSRKEEKWHFKKRVWCDWKTLHSCSHPYL